jgi:hypothetical protein
MQERYVPLLFLFIPGWPGEEQSTEGMKSSQPANFFWISPSDPQILENWNSGNEQSRHLDVQADHLELFAQRL